jgi:hypothetical protein
VEEAVLRNGRAVEFGPWEIDLVREEYFESFAFQAAPVAFDEPGEYEFQLWVDDGEDPIARERMFVRE